MSYSIEDTNKYMTIFYSKMDGEIMNTTAGKETMFFFADREKEYSLIWNYIQVPYVAEVMHYPQLFKVVDGELTLKSTAFANLKIVK
ncbi:hypothetical protein [Clostridium perfringens]|uniref:hypothetical protein n=1 Tax=Clostridium perfringens TaxID=1502 RepID=UPI0018E4238C|nr:hypothetical protein [Clostridium perfringens]MBI6050346.1 hypothetical protein [Clostridium perfringens]